MALIILCGRLAVRRGSQIDIELPTAGCRVDELRRRITERDAALGEELADRGERACVGDDIVGNDCWVRTGQSIVFFPPLSGG